MWYWILSGLRKGSLAVVILQQPLAQEFNRRVGPLRLNEYTAAIAGYSLFIGVLVSLLLLGVIFVVYSSFQARRPQDEWVQKIGEEDQSSLQILPQSRIQPSGVVASKTSQEKGEKKAAA